MHQNKLLPQFAQVCIIPQLQKASKIMLFVIAGDNGWFGLDWLTSIKDVFEQQINEFKPNESEEWINRFDNDSTENEKVLPNVRIGGFEKLRMFKCSL